MHDRHPKIPARVATIVALLLIPAVATAAKLKVPGDHGFHVLDTGNTFRANKTKKTIGFGLLDEAGGNVYEKNKFDSEAFD